MADRNVKVILSLQAKGFEEGANKAAAATDRLSVATAKADEAARKLAVAEQRLAELRADSKTKASALMAAEEDVRKARENLADATARVAEGNGTFTERLRENEQALNTVSTAAMTAGTAMLAGVGLAAKGYADFDKQMSAVKATGVGVGAEFDALREKAIELGASTSFSASEAAQGIEELAKAGLSASDILDGGLAGALDLAAAGSISVAEAAETTAVTLKQFALDGSQAAHVADLLAAGANEAVGSVSDIGAALNMSGTVAAQFGISIEETVGTLAMFASNALIGSDAGTSFKAMLLQLAQPTGKARELLDEYNISAYDAQGNFVGMESLAGQLKTQLGSLSQEQQNAALKTIFGADAIRTATVLMDEGAEGVRKWTDAVNQQGYAAEMSQMKLDNLSGDLEELGGAFDSLFIRSGSGMNDFLRVAVQGTTDLVNALAGVPGPVLATGVALAGIAGAGLLAVGGFVKVVSTAAELHTSIKTLNTEFPKLGGHLKNAGRYATVALVGIAALGAAFHAMQSSAEAALPPVNDIEIALAKLGTGQADMSDLAANFSTMTGYAGSFSEALDFMNQRIGDGQNGMAGFIDFTDGLGSALGGMKTGTQLATEAFGRMDAALMQMSDADASAAFRQITADAAAQGVSVETLAKLFPQYAARVQEAANASGGAATSAEALAGSLDEAGSSAADAATQTAEYLSALVELGNAMLGLSGSQIGYEAALDDATEAIKEHGKAVLDASGMIDIGSEKGRALKQSLDGVAGSALSVIDSMTKTGQSTQAVADFQARAAVDFLKTADAMGVGSAAAIQMAADYGLIPQDVATQISAPGADLTEQQIKDVISATAKVPSLTQAQILAPGARNSKAEVDEFVRSVGKVPGLTEAEIRTMADLYGVRVAQQEIDKVRSKTVTVTVAYRSTGAPHAVADGGLFTRHQDALIQQFASGGFASIGSQQPQLRPAGGRGILWAEEGAGPWEAFISGHPAKRRRSRWILEETARRLGGFVSWATAYADGGLHQPIRYAPSMPPTPYITASGGRRSADVVRMIPSELVVVDVNGQLIGRMRTEAMSAIHGTVSTARGL